MSDEKKNKVVEFFNKFLSPEAKAAFKKEFGEIPTLQTTPTPTAMTEGKLKDGTVIKYDTPTLAVGSMLMVVGQDGTELPAPNGDWELEDGTVFKTVDGKVTELTPATPAAPSEPVTQAAAVEQPNKLVEALKVLMEGRFAEQAKLIESLTEENKALKAEFAKQTEVINTVSAFFNAIGEVKTGEVTGQTGTSKGPASYAKAYHDTHSKK